ncbi:MAG: hypothetical protein MJ089_00950 [Ruminococcus sp.]|nr:hypothetical protein [Ruminococcus sp.]
MKMNGLYVAGFIILFLCLPLFFAGIIVAYLFEEIYLSAIFTAGGSFLALLGIIFTMLSKPKKKKTENNRDE